MKNTFTAILAGTVLAVVSSSVLADRTLKKSSDKAIVNVNVEIPKMVSITTPSDIPLIKYAGSKGVEAMSDFCIANNHKSGNVQLSISNGDAGSKFFLKKTGSTETGLIKYSVSYKSNGTDIPFDNNMSLAVSGAKMPYECEASPHSGSSVKIKINESEAKSVNAGLYTSTLTLTVSAQ